MIAMKVRYEISNVNLKISNVTLPRAEDSYVLLTASDEHNNEVVFALSHQQADHLENQLYEANRRWRMSAAAPSSESTVVVQEPITTDYDEPFEEPFTH